jgi:glyoxylase-like metal-dependent hydrolase (beta-lactamase superfamily II)
VYNDAVKTLVHPWTTPPAAGETIAVAPGIKWLRMPLPFQLNHINLWLVEDDGAWAIVDTGAGLAPTRQAWEQIFATQLDGKPISRVIVTHFHPDHMGNAGWLVARFGVDFWCTQAEYLSAQLAWRQRDGRDAEKRLAHYRDHGFSDEALDAFRRRGNHYPEMVPTLAEQYRCLRDGDVLAIGSRKWEVLTVLGHAPEHMCLWSRDDGILISGDQVLPKITTNVSVWPDQPLGNPLRLYLDSLQRFRPMTSETLVLPSHGLPFQGLHTRLDMLHSHHDERLAETVDAVAEPRTGVELIPRLFRRELDTHQLSFAIGEVLAHLHFLQAEGAVTRETDAGGVHRFRKL